MAERCCTRKRAYSTVQSFCRQCINKVQAFQCCTSAVQSSALRHAVQCFTYTEQSTVILQGCAVAYLHYKYRVNSSCKMYSASHTYSTEFPAQFTYRSPNCTASHIQYMHILWYIEEVCIMLRNMKHGAETEIHFARSHLRFSGPLMHRTHFSVSVHVLYSAAFCLVSTFNTYMYLDMNRNIIVSLCYFSRIYVEKDCKILRNTIISKI